MSEILIVVSAVSYIPAVQPHQPGKSAQGSEPARVRNAKAYEVRFALAAPGQPQGAWQSGGLHTN